MRMGTLPCGCRSIEKLEIRSASTGNYFGYVNRRYSYEETFCHNVRNSIAMGSTYIFTCPRCGRLYTTDFEVACNFVRRR
jgi:ABC-type Mn2+/Zn2+ transport system ATPase subunit